MKFCKFGFIQRVGCLSSLNSIIESQSSTNSGRHDGSPIATDDLAKLMRQSSSAKTLMARNHKERSVSNSEKTRDLKFFMAVFRFSCASLS
jgi:hypothetical protein